MATLALSTERRLRVLSVAAAASVALYALVAVVAEPMRSLAATSTDSITVEVEVQAGIAITCDDDGTGSSLSNSTLSLPAIVEDGDTGAYADARAVTCNVRTNNTNGYTLGWLVTSGSGGTATGHMINQYEDIIAAYSPAVDGTPETWSVGVSDSRWGARLSSTSPAFDAATKDFGTDGASEKYLNVATGSTVTIGQEPDESANGGDDNKVGFRVEVGTSKIQPTGTYQTFVQFTAATQ